MSAPPLVIANPVAGNGRARPRMRSLEPLLAGWSTPPRLSWTERRGHALELARQARAAGTPLLVAAGGDGTVHEVVNGMLAAGRQGAPALACLPLGTGNDFARALGLRGDLEHLAVDPGKAPERRVDLARAHAAVADDGEWLVNAANVGLGGRVADRVAVSPLLRRLRRGAYAAAALSVLAGYRPRWLVVRVDGTTVWNGPALNVSICNGPFFGGGMRPVAAASLASGKLHVVVVHPMRAWSAVRQLGSVVRAREPDPRRVTTVAGREVSVERADGAEDPGRDPADRPEAPDVEIDGTPRGPLPIRFEVHAAALRVRVPSGRIAGVRGRSAD